MFARRSLFLPRTGCAIAKIVLVLAEVQLERVARFAIKIRERPAIQLRYPEPGRKSYRIIGTSTPALFRGVGLYQLKIDIRQPQLQVATRCANVAAATAAAAAATAAAPGRFGRAGGGYSALVGGPGAVWEHQNALLEASKMHRHEGEPGG